MGRLARRGSLAIFIRHKVFGFPGFSASGLLGFRFLGFRVSGLLVFRSSASVFSGFPVSPFPG